MSPTTCRMQVRQEVCDAYGLASGQTLSLSDLDTRIRNFPMGDDFDAIAAFGHCILLHESVHACQSSTELKDRNCVEIEAHRRSNDCLRDMYESFCDAGAAARVAVIDEPGATEPQPPRTLDERSCKMLTEEVCFGEGSAVFNSCLCNISNETQDDAGECQYQCFRAVAHCNGKTDKQIDTENPDLPVYRNAEDYCRSIRRAYGPR